MSTVRKIIKSLIPEPIRRQIRLRRAAKNLREAYFGNQLRTIRPIILATGETHNFTYDLTDTNLRYMAETLAIATDKPVLEIEGYIQELLEDRELREFFLANMKAHVGQKSPDNVRSPFGRRIGWYAVVRATKPRIVIETGVERGHGALLLCAALLRNQKEGFMGRYIGTDINPSAGWLLSGPYAAMGQVVIGDSVTTLRGLSETIDVFINDSDHSADYEGVEYETIAPRLSEQAIVLGDNAHVTDKLAVFSRKMGRDFLMFHEKPKNHWYPGAGIGISFRHRSATIPHNVRSVDGATR